MIELHFKQFSVNLIICN